MRCVRVFENPHKCRQITVCFGSKRGELYSLIMELSRNNQISPGKQITKMLGDICYFEERVEKIEECVKRFERRMKEEPSLVMLAFSQFMRELREARVEALARNMERV